VDRHSRVFRGLIPAAALATVLAGCTGARSVSSTGSSSASDDSYELGFPTSETVVRSRDGADLQRGREIAPARLDAILSPTRAFLTRTCRADRL
jgi:hypothetical protein